MTRRIRRKRKVGGRRPLRQMVGGRKRIRRQRGSGFFGDLWSGIKKAGNWVKDNRIISGVAKAIPNPISQVVGNVAHAVGLGRHRARGRLIRFKTMPLMRGKGLSSYLSSGVATSPMFF